MKEGFWGKFFPDKGLGTGKTISSKEGQGDFNRPEDEYPEGSSDEPKTSDEYIPGDELPDTNLNPEEILLTNEKYKQYINPDGEEMTIAEYRHLEGYKNDDEIEEKEDDEEREKRQSKEEREYQKEKEYDNIMEEDALAEIKRQKHETQQRVRADKEDVHWREFGRTLKPDSPTQKQKVRRRSSEEKKQQINL